jgi:hypothetical protein
MGMFKAMRDLQKESREISKNTDFGQMRKDGMNRMAAAQERMAQMTKQANLQATGVSCAATVVAVRETGMVINMEPVAELDLTVLPDGLPPYPATIQQAVSQFYIPRIQPGASLSVKVDPNDPSSIFIDIMGSFAPKPPGAA